MKGIDNKEIIKFVGKVSSRFPQIFPKNRKTFCDGEFAILNFDVIETLEGNVEVNKYGNISVKGYHFPSDYNTNSHYVILAQLESKHPQYGKQWESLSCNEQIDISDVWQQKIFLQSFLSDNQIQKLYNKLDDPMKCIVERDKEKLMTVDGIGEKSVEKILDKYEANKDYSEAIIELTEYGMTPFMIKKLTDIHGSAKILVNKVKDNPYILASEVQGIGFKKVDDFALKAGLPRLSNQRLRAYIDHILNEGAMSGYSWIDSGVLLTKIEEELDLFPQEQIIEVVNEMKDKGVVWNEEFGKIALKRYYKLEEDICKELIRIRDGENNFNFKGWEDRVKQAEKLQGFDFTDEQLEAIKNTMKHQAMVITGKGGSGKTSTVLGAVKALGDVTFAQTSLSGKASARLEEVTGYSASTIHRLLGFSPNNYTKENPSVFTYNKDNQLSQDIVVLDEFAMVGGKLFLSLLEAIPTGSKLILLGDMGQLPAIGSLNIGKDITKTTGIHTSYLNKIHRQAKKSAIITDSIKISNGKQIISKDFIGREIRGELQDLELDIYSDSKETVPKVIEHFKEKLKMSGNNVMEVQVICPMNLRGDSSVFALNQVLQPLYNPNSFDKKEVLLPLEKDKVYTLREGDKVINVKNNYEMAVVEKDEWGDWQKVYLDEMEDDFKKIAIFNGYSGMIKQITHRNQIIIYFPLTEKTVLVEPSHWKKEKAIHLAYASTCHKCQGSSFKYPICVYDNSHYIMLNRENVYTSITRASKHATLIAQNKSLRLATDTTAVQNKQTFLKEMLDKYSI